MYRQSQLGRNVLEELDHVNQSISDGASGPDEAADYATSFLYQASQLCFSETHSHVGKHTPKNKTIPNKYLRDLKSQLYFVVVMNLTLNTRLRYRV